MVNTDKVLPLVKARLNRLDERLDEYLRLRIEAAAEYLEEKGIELHADDDSPMDMLLVADVAVHQYRNVEENGPEPEWLRNRIFERTTKPAEVDGL